MGRKSDDRIASVIAGVIVTLGIVVVFAIAIGVRYLMAGGVWACAWSTDPALCAAVVGR